MDKLTEILRKKIILPVAALGATALFANNAHAQGFETDFKKKKSEPAISVADDEATVRKKLSELYGYAWTGGNSSPSERGAIAGAGLEWRVDNLRPSILTHNAWQKYDNQDAEDLRVASHRVMAGLGAYLHGSPELEVYIRPEVGKEWNRFSKAVKMDADRVLGGATAGVASQKDGTRLLVSAYGGKGDYDAELLSGFENDGDYDSFFLGGEVTQRLFGKGKLIEPGSEFDMNRDLGEEFKHSLHVLAQAYKQKDEFGELLTADSAGGKVSLPYVLNLREYGRDAKDNIYAKGYLFEFTPFVEFQHYETESGLSLRTTDASITRAGLAVKWKVNKYLGLRAAGGHQWYNLDVNDPSQGINSDEDKNGAFGEFTVNLEFKF